MIWAWEKPSRHWQSLLKEKETNGSLPGPVLLDMPDFCGNELAA